MAEEADLQLLRSVVGEEAEAEGHLPQAPEELVSKLEVGGEEGAVDLCLRNLPVPLPDLLSEAEVVVRRPVHANLNPLAEVEAGHQQRELEVVEDRWKKLSSPQTAAGQQTVHSAAKTPQAPKAFSAVEEEVVGPVYFGLSL